MFLKNESARPITIGKTLIIPRAVAQVEEDKTHKGVASMLERGLLVESNEKEFKAFSDAAEKEKAEKKAGK